MAQDVIDLVEPFLSDDPTRWAKLASDVQWRRMQLLLLREILVELRKLNSLSEDEDGNGSGAKASLG